MDRDDENLKEQSNEVDRSISSIMVAFSIDMHIESQS